MRLAIDCDDNAVELKNVLLRHLNERGIDATDLDFLAANTGSYPDVGYNLAKKIRDGEFDRGILICGTGLGMAIIANKVEGVYAGTAHDVYSAERLRKSNNAQVLTMGSLVIGPQLARTIVDAWLPSEFQGGRSQPKVDRIRQLEHESFHPGA